MQKYDRLRKILAFLKKNTSTTFTNLSSNLDINRETLRRDLETLQKEGVIAREKRKIFITNNNDTRTAFIHYGLLTQEERLQSILDLIRKKKTMRVTSLAQIFHVTHATMRADLKKLDQIGQIKLYHGYVALCTNENELQDNLGSSLNNSVDVVSMRAANHIESGDIIFLDNSLFSLAIVKHLTHQRNITVITFSLRVAIALSKLEYPCEIILLSSSLEPSTHIHYLISDDDFFEKTKITKAFFGLGTFLKRKYFSLESPLPYHIFLKLCDTSKEIYFCISSRNIGRNIETHDAILLNTVAKHLIEIIVDDEVSPVITQTMLPKGQFVVYCGTDYIYHLNKTMGKRIGLSLYPGHFDFRQEVAESIEQACKQYSEIRLSIRQNDGTYETIIDNINQFINDEIDILIEYSSNYDVGELIIQKFNNQGIGIPTIMIDLPVQNTYYFGANNVEAGQIAGIEASRYIINQWNGQIDSIILLGKDISGSVCQKRLLGSIDSLREQVKFNARIIKTINCSQGFAYYNDRLKRHLDRISENDTCLVISFGEDTTVDSHNLICEYAKTKNIIMVAQNFSKHVKHLMSNPYSPIIGCVSYEQENYGTRIIEIVTKILNGEKVDLVNYTHHKWIPNTFRQSQ